MVTQFRSALAALLLVLWGMPAAAQMIKDPTTWTYEVKKKGGDKYDLIFHLKIQEKWHIWSLHPGGDGYEIAPSFTFNNNPKLKLDGEVTEKGTPVTTVMEGVDGKVTYFSGNVDYTQSVTLNGQGKIFGKLTYQVCNDVMCLPPKDKEFTFVVK